MILFSSETFGDYLRRLRLAQSYSQDQLAILLNVSQNAYCLMENGRTRITLEHIQGLAQAFDMSPWQLVAGYHDYVLMMSPGR